MERKKLVKVCGVVISFLGIIGITYREDLKKGYQKIKEPDNQKEVVWITESSIKDIQDEMEAGLNKLLEKKGCCYKVKFVSFPMETYEDDVKKIQQIFFIVTCVLWGTIEMIFIHFIKTTT